jgi:hypothetical protein
MQSWQALGEEAATVDECLPLTQSKHAEEVFAASVSEYLPAAHEAHSTLPGMEEYVPAPHGEHASKLLAWPYVGGLLMISADPGAPLSPLSQFEFIVTVVSKA